MLRLVCASGRPRTEGESHGTPFSASLPPGCVMLRPPQPGDRFVVPDRHAIMTVEVCHLGVSNNDCFSRFLVRAHGGPLRNSRANGEKLSVQLSHFPLFLLLKRA